MQRNESVWEKPTKFSPERWLPSNLGGWGPEPGSDGYNRMSEHYMPFGVGARDCAGKSMALILMKLALSSLIRDFEIKADRSETNEKTMEERDTHFVSN